MRFTTPVIVLLAASGVSAAAADQVEETRQRVAELRGRGLVGVDAQPERALREARAVLVVVGGRLTRRFEEESRAEAS